MKNLYLFIIIVFFCMVSNQGRGQTTYNIVPNGDFEFGSTPLCFDHSYIPILVEEKINFWKSAKGTPDWMDVSLCLSSINIYNTSPDYLTLNHFPSNRFIRLGPEAIRVGIQYLTPGKKYILRIKIAPATPNHWNPENNQQIKVLLTKFSQHWASDPNWFGGGNIKEEIATFNIHGNLSPVNFQWHHREITFTAPTTADQLGNLIILCSKGTVFIDDVELFEICSENLIFENTTFSYKEPVYESNKYIYAGYDISNPPPGSGNVIVQQNSDVKFKAGKAIILEHGFEAEHGSDFEAWIEPCDGWDNPANLKELCIRPGDCINIGGNYNPLFNYSWSPSFYLDNPHIPNPIACLPNSEFGTIIYTLTITDDIGNQIGMPIEVELSYYPSTPMYGLSVTNHPLPNEATMFWHCDLSFQYNTEKIVVLLNNHTGTIKEYELNAGSDWAYTNNLSNINLHFSTEPDFFQPGLYFINIGYKIFCSNQWVFNIGYNFNHEIGGFLSSESLFCTNDTIFFDNIFHYLYSLLGPLNESIDELVFLWDFGDGNTSNTVFPKKAYPSDGIYLISLNIDDGLIFNETLYQNVYIDDCINNNKSFQPPNTYTLQNDSSSLLISPNPFSDKIYVHFEVAIEEQVKISLYDVFGNCAAEIMNKEMSKGKHSVTFNDSSLPPGMYFCIMQTPNQRKVLKVVKM